MNNITNARIFNTNLIDGPMRFKHYLEENCIERETKIIIEPKIYQKY